MICHKYSIAGLTVEIVVHRPNGRLPKQAAAYLCPNDTPADITIDIPAGTARVRLAENPHLTPEELEYILTGAEFFAEILRFDGIGLHASAVVYDGGAYLFSATSGTGKSTHTQLWRDYFGSENCFILNDDKPVLRYINGTWFACGTPWSGKSDLNRPVLVPLRAIAFLERGTENSIEPLDSGEAVYRFFEQTLRPTEQSAMTVALDRTIELLGALPPWLLRCRPDLDAVKTAYQAMKGT